MASSPSTKKRWQNFSSGESSMTAAEKVGSNPDLIGKILSDLCLKSLISCMLVSKTWYEFIKEKLSSHIGQTSGLIIRKTPRGSYGHVSLVNDHHGEEVQIGMERLKSYGRPTILQSCNGLLLLVYDSIRYGIAPVCCPSPKKYYVYNMASMEMNFLHQLCLGGGLTSINLVRDPSGSPRYKVVAIRPLDRYSDELFKIRIYTSSAMAGDPGQWRSFVVGPFDPNFSLRYCNGVSWKDNIIWTNYHPEVSLLCFNVSREEFRHIPSPPMWKHGSVYLQESRGHLHAIELYSRFFTKIEVFQLENDLSGWFLKYHVNLSDQKLLFDHPKNFPFFLTLIQETREDDVSLLVYIPNQIISYNLKAKTCRKLCDLVIDVDEFEDEFEDEWEDYRSVVQTFAHHHSLPGFFSSSSNSRTANQAKKR